ncbi:hypothetical protein Tco_1075272 [Tanacetum coccineum]
MNSRPNNRYNDVEESLWSKRDTVVALEDTNIANHSEPNVGRPMNIKPTGSFPSLNEAIVPILTNTCLGGNIPSNNANSSMFINDPKSLFGLGGITPTSWNSVDQNFDPNSDSPIVKSMDINMQPTSYAKAAGASTSEQPTNKVVTAPVVNNTNNANTSNDGFQHVVNNKCNNKKSAIGNKIPKGVLVAKVFQVGKDFNYQPKALSTVSNGGGTHDETSYKAGLSSYSNEGDSVVKKVTSNDRQKDKDVVDTGVMKISNISSPNPFASLGDEEDEDDDIENVYDESANLNLNHTLGTSTPKNIVPAIYVPPLEMDIEWEHLQQCSRISLDNYYVDRRALWNNLVGHTSLMRDKSWVLLGNFYAALNLEDHSCGGYEPNIAMREFKECVHDMEEGFHEVVESCWNLNVEGCVMYHVVKRLKGLKSPFRKLLHTQGNLHNRVDLFRKELNEIQNAIDKEPNNSDLQEELAHYLLAFKEASLNEERFLRQKSKIERLKAGDYNTTYFHKIVKSKCARNWIEMVCDSSNILHEGNAVAGAFVNHYEKNLGIEGSTTPLLNQDLFSHVLDSQKAEFMVRDITDNEIKDVIFFMGDDKAPSLDGFPSGFFKKA